VFTDREKTAAYVAPLFSGIDVVPSMTAILEVLFELT
jgi:hypothetical protein